MFILIDPTDAADVEHQSSSDGDDEKELSGICRSRKKPTTKAIQYPAEMLPVQSTSTPKLPLNSVSTVMNARSGKRESWIWDHFDLFEDKKKKHLALCKHCNKEIDRGKDCGTSTLIRHINNEHEPIVKKRDEQLLQSVKSGGIQTFLQNHLPVAKKKRVGFHAAYLKWIVSAYLPLRTGESEEFKNMLAEANATVEPLNSDKTKGNA